MKFSRAKYQETLTNPAAFQKYILGEPVKLSPIQADILGAIGGFYETIVVAGAKGGKSMLSSFAALWAVYRLLTVENPHEKYGLVPNSKIYIMCIGPKSDIALNIMLNYITGYAENSWYMSKYIENYRAEELIFTDNIIVKAQGSSSRAGLGYQIYALIMDEVCHFMDTVGSMSGTRVLNSYAPRLLPFGTDGRIVAISTPAGRTGVGYEMFKTGTPQPRPEFKGNNENNNNNKNNKPNKNIEYSPETHYILQREKSHGEQPFRAVFQASTWDMNPLFPYSHPYLAKERIRDPWFFEREYGAKFADVVSAFFSPKQLDSCVEHMPLPIQDRSNHYVLAHDPGIKQDNWALAMGHIMKDGRVRIDMARQWNPTKKKVVDVLAIEKYIVDLCGRYDVVDILADQSRAIGTIKKLYSLGLPSRGMSYRAMTDVKLYQNLLELVNTKNISLPPDVVLVNQLKFLERITLANRFRVQGAPGSADDLADAVAMVAYALTVEKMGGGILKI